MNQMPSHKPDIAVPSSDDPLKDCRGEGCVAVVATYNEIENLPRLVERLHQLFPQLSVLVIDDGSPDGTGTWCDQFQETHPWFHVLHRSGKQGLGSATILGFQWALKKGLDRVLTMDADFSHSPDEVIRLLQRSLQLTSPGIVIGSRYVAGGEIEGWPLGRRIASRCINTFARIWLRLASRDNSGAFRCYDRAALEKIDLPSIQNQGYGYLEEILYLARRQQIPLHEVPITFRDRVAGESKINAREAINTVWTLGMLGLKLRINKLRGRS